MESDFERWTKIACFEATKPDGKLDVSAFLDRLDELESMERQRKMPTMAKLDIDQTLDELKSRLSHIMHDKDIGRCQYLIEQLRGVDAANESFRSPTLKKVVKEGTLVEMKNIEDGDNTMVKLTFMVPKEGGIDA